MSFPRPSRIAVLALAAAAASGNGRAAAAGCATANELRALDASVVGALRCERERIRGLPCVPASPPACASDVVQRVLTLAGLPGIQPGDRALRRVFGCQRAIAAASAKAAHDRIQGARRGIPTIRVERRTIILMRQVVTSCDVIVEQGTDGTGVPRAGQPCDAAIPAVGGGVDAKTLSTCLDRTLGATLEPVLRHWLKPSIVFILTDDQPASMVWPMETVQHELVDRGVTFGEAAVTTPLCAPSRATILTGEYAHNHGVETNASLGRFDDSSTIATWLHDAGYRTSLVGKYINGYGGSPPVPPGWDDWHAVISGEYFGNSVMENGVVQTYGSDESDYIDDVLARKAVEFIEQAGDQPFFLYFAPFAPHAPATPAPRDVGRFAATPPWRPPSYDEADVSDKPLWLQNDVPLLTPELMQSTDSLYESMLESLLAVDDGVAAILRAIADAGRENDTIVVFTSDNGLALGEHRIVGKDCPYEECVRVPFIVRYPRLVTAARSEARPVANVDLAETFAEFGGATPTRPVDGVSMTGLLDGSATSWRSDLLVEQFSLFPKSYASVWGGPVKYVEYVEGIFDPGQVELYDLQRDPYELTSSHLDPAYADTRAALAARLREIDPPWTQPVPP